MFEWLTETYEIPYWAVLVFWLMAGYVARDVWGLITGRREGDKDRCIND